MPGITFAKTIANCMHMASSLAPVLGTYPDLVPNHDALEDLIIEVRSLDVEQQLLTGRLRQITRLRQEAELRGQDLRSQVVAQLRGKLGFTNETLLAFGIPPRKRRKGRRETPAVEPVPPAPENEPPPVTE